MATVFLASSNYRLIKVKIVPFGEKKYRTYSRPRVFRDNSRSKDRVNSIVQCRSYLKDQTKQVKLCQHENEIPLKLLPHIRDAQSAHIVIFQIKSSEI